MKWYAVIREHTIDFGSEIAARRFAEHSGKPIIIELDEKPSREMRRFFEGAVVPACFYQSATAWSDFRECREALKLEFLPGWTKSIKGVQVRTPRSTSGLSKESFRGFLGRIEVWFMDCGFEWPDPAAYKAWRDSGPLKGEIYPPLKRLKEAHDRRMAIAEPWNRSKLGQQIGQ